MKQNDVPIVREGKRGCGYRKAGGLYLRSDGLGQPCGKLPLPLTVCPTCGEGIRPSRSATWVDALKLFASRECDNSKCQDWLCPLSDGRIQDSFGEDGRAYLIWVGEYHYKHPEDFALEAEAMGISRRVNAVPRGFVLGTTCVLLAHVNTPLPREAVEPGDMETLKVERGAAVFKVFRPDRIEYVVKGDETEEELDRLVERRITPVRVEGPQ